MSESSGRLQQVDALRGLAALAVALFHYTHQVSVVLPSLGQARWSVAWGHYGVNLFFIISGFVIFMTLERTRRPMDFVVSRFSRLFPAYWVAIVCTFAVVSWFGLPGKEVSGWQALANVLMLHSLLAHVPHVDGVYWTLEVELLFYLAMFSIYRLGRLSQLHWFLAAGLAIKVLYWLSARHFGVDLPWILYRVFFLQALPWFTLGIGIYLLVQDSHEGQRWHARGLIGAALAVLALTEPMSLSSLGLATKQMMPLGLAPLALLLAALVWGAATRRLSALNASPLVLLGAMSYPLYLLHENIGWALQRQLVLRGWSLDATIWPTLGLALLLAWLLMRTVERPAMAAIRSAYRARHSPTAVATAKG